MPGRVLNLNKPHVPTLASTCFVAIGVVTEASIAEGVLNELKNTRNDGVN